MPADNNITQQPDTKALLALVAQLSEANKKQQEAHKKEVDSLLLRIDQLTAQVAWLNRQLFGRKSEKLRPYDPRQLPSGTGHRGSAKKLQGISSMRRFCRL